MENERLATQPVPKLLLSLAATAICAQIVTLLYNLVDRIYIGWMADGMLAIASVGICAPIVTVVTATRAEYGLLRPVIVLPTGGPALDNLPAVLRHELTHYRRRDLWYKALLALVTGIHWFNPLVHTMGRAVSLDCERSCDRAVVKGLDAGERRAYGDMLLALAARRRLPPGVTATTLWEGKRQLKARLLEIRDCKRVTGAGVCLMAAAVLLLGCCACGLPWSFSCACPCST